MNFEKIPPVETSKHFLDIAFRKAREKGKVKNLTGNWLQIIRQKESLKLDVVKDNIVPRLDKIVEIFPDTRVMSKFYIDLMKLTLDYGELKKSLGAVSWAAKRIRLLHKEYVSKINKTKEKEKIKGLVREFYGRISSTLKQIDPNLKYLETSRKIMRTYPDIKEMFTVCIYGFPNVGKTTLLNKLAKTKAKTAEYSFTTKSINAGYLTFDDIQIQVLDVPGTLAREEMNNIELQAELVIKNLADVIVYVFDLSESCGYSVKKQEKLLKALLTKPSKKDFEEVNQNPILKKLESNKPVLIYLSKTDIPEGKPGNDFKHKTYSFTELKKEILKLAKSFKNSKE